MDKKSVEPKNDIIIEGSVGERLFVLASGKVQVLQNDRVVHNLSHALNIFYNFDRKPNGNFLLHFYYKIVYSKFSKIITESVIILNYFEKLSYCTVIV